MTSTHVAVPGSDRIPLPGARALGPANPHTIVEVLLKLRRKREFPELQGRPSDMISREELGQNYGTASADIEKVGEVFEKLGLKIVAATPETRSVLLSGTIGQMETAFQTKLFNYEHSDGNYRGRVGAVHVPSAVKDIVEGVFGLDDRRVARRRRRTVRHAEHLRDLSAVPNNWYLPKELAAHYNFPAGDGGGQTIGLLEFGGGYFKSDLEQFCKTAKLEVPAVKAVSTDGLSTRARDGAEGEVMLDVEVVAGVCPKANIVVYFAHFTEKGWITALDTAVHDKANQPGVLSVSWGYAEDAYIWTKSAMKQVNETLMDAAHAGVTVCVAAGDDGSSDAISDGHAHVDFPASSPYVLAVGGTTIPKKGAGQPDIFWFEGDGLREHQGGGGGGGVSALFPRPKWQKDVSIKSVNPGAIVGRCIPDLAANADWTASPYLLVVDGGAQPNGGTSAAAPLVASLITLINAQRGDGKRIGYVTPILYQSAGGVPVGKIGFTDVAQGSNATDKIGGYTAAPGYDAVSGWGTPNGIALMNALSVAAP